MHVVTKILLVFCAVLSLLLAALTMAYAANAGAIRDGYRAMELDKIAAEAARDNIQSQQQEKQAEWSSKIEAAVASLRQIEVENKALQSQRTELQTQLEQAKAASLAAENRFVEVGGTVSTQAELIKAYREEVTSLRDAMVKASRREAEITKVINDLESQREVLDGNVRALQEQLKEAQLALQTAQSGGTARAGDQPFEHVGAPIFARVTSVTKSPNGDDLVMINEGSNRNIKQNMIMNLKRGNAFLGKLVILSVDANSAVGRLDKLGRDVAVQADDEVVSTLMR